LNLRRCDIDETSSVALIRSLKKRGKQHVRRIPIPAQLTKRILNMPVADTGRLWPFSRATAWRLVKTAMISAGIFGIHATCKGLRHAFGVRCVLANVPLPIIQGWMGHADSNTTAIYLAVRDEEERALIEKTW
jgi:integrase